MSSRAQFSKQGVGRYYPTEDQLKDPRALARTLRVVLDQHYALQDKYNALEKSHAELQAKVGAKQSGPPPGSGPTDTQLLGLFVEPVDTNSLANGAALKFNSARGTFSFQ